MKKAIVTLLILAGVFTSIYFVISSRGLQSRAIRFFTGGRLVLNPYINIFKSTVAADSIVFSTETGFLLKANNIKLKYNPFGFFAGRFVIEEIRADGLNIEVPPVKADGEKKHKKISIKRLLFLETIAIEDAKVENVQIRFAEGSTLTTDLLTLHYTKRYSGGVAVSVNLQGANLASKDSNVSLGNLSLKGKTTISKWFADAPYVNALQGSLNIQDISTSDITLSGLTANLEIEDGKYHLYGFELLKGAGKANGDIELDTADESFKADIKIPDPITVPTLGGENPTIDTAGAISGKLDITGKGFSLGSNSFIASLDLKQAKEGLEDLNLIANIEGRSGVVRVSNAKLMVGTGKIDINGTVNIPSKNINLKFIASDVPLTGVFGRFYDTNFHPIFGTGEAEAEFKGWGADFSVTGKAQTKGPSGYYKITTELAKADINVTDKEFKLDGEIIDGGERSGNIKLSIKYGKKVEGEVRSKELFIDANAINNDLSMSFKAYDLKGIGNAHMLLKGPLKTFKSQLTGQIENGSFLGIAFQKVTTQADLTNKNLIFKEGVINLPNIEQVTFTAPLKMDFEPGGFRFYGKPLDYLEFDTRMIKDHWTFKNIRYRDINISGSYASLGSVDLNIAGSIEGEYLSSVKDYFREAKGPIAGKLKISGPATSPLINGNIVLHDNTLYFRDFNKRMEEVTGDIHFNGRDVSTEKIVGKMEDGYFQLSGKIGLQNFAPQSYDVSFKGENLRYTLPDRSFRFEFDTDLKITGSDKATNIAGDITLLEGKYTKDFNLLDSLKSTQYDDEDSFKGSNNVILDLKIRNTGDLSIKNNIGEIWLKADVDVKGTTAKPLITGTVETQEGKIHYLGRDFNITKGFVEFRAPRTDPYIEITAEHEVPSIPDMVIYVTVRGYTNNLNLDLTSTKGMEKRDIISMLMFGATEQDLKGSQLGSGLGQSMAASQLGYILEKPITKLTKFDVFRLESGTPTTSTSGKTSAQSASSNVSRVYLSKQLTDRFNFEFMTDISVQDAQQTVRANYMINDYLLLGGERATGQIYKLNLMLRFRER